MHNTQPLERGRIALTGLLVGDAIGDRFSIHLDLASALVKARALPSSPWYFTNNTQMALSIASVLKLFAHINQDELAQSFIDHYDPQ